MRTYEFECKYCARPVEIQAETKHVAKRRLPETTEWRNFAGKGWVCPECVRDYEMSLKSIWANPFVRVTHDQLYEMTDAYMKNSTPRYDERSDLRTEEDDRSFTIDDLYALEEELPTILEKPRGEEA